MWLICTFHKIVFYPFSRECKGKKKVEVNKNKSKKVAYINQYYLQIVCIALLKPV